VSKVEVSEEIVLPPTISFSFSNHPAKIEVGISVQWAVGCTQNVQVLHLMMLLWNPYPVENRGK
jgi:hypothetical protein